MLPNYPQMCKLGPNSTLPDMVCRQPEVINPYSRPTLADASSQHRAYDSLAGVGIPSLWISMVSTVLTRAGLGLGYAYA